jgi:hypothetical protein
MDYHAILLTSMANDVQVIDRPLALAIIAIVHVKQIAAKNSSVQYESRSCSGRDEVCDAAV